MICPRCGAEKGHLHNHMPACERVPLPAELVECWHADPELTADGLRYRYQSSDKFIVARLIQGGLTRKQIRERGRQVYRKKSAETYRHRRGRRALTRDGERCERCEILLEHPLVPRGENGMCEWCQAEMVKEAT